MSVEAILAAIEASGEAEAARLRAEAQERTGQRLAEAERTAAARRKEAMCQALLPVATERARRLHHAKLEALCVVGEVRDQIVETTLAQARGRLALIRDDPDYPRILRRLTEEAIGMLGAEDAQDGQCQLEIDPRDQVLLRHILDDLRLDPVVALSLDCWGGLIARSGDGRIVAINTVEARLERAIPFLRRDLAAFFEKGQTCPTSTTATLECGR